MTFIQICGWLIILFYLSFVVFGAAIFFERGPVKVSPEKRSDPAIVFLVRLTGLVAVIIGIEGIVNSLASSAEITWLNTEHMVAATMVALLWFIFGVGQLWGLLPANSPAKPARRILFGGLSIVIGAGYFFVFSDTYFDNESLEELGRNIIVAGGVVLVVGMLYWGRKKDDGTEDGKDARFTERN